MTNIPTIRSRQRGTVAIMTGLTAVALFAFGGLALDLGHLYVAKSELQNAADAAALAGAKELNHTAAGVTAAVNKAIAIAAQHKYDFKTPINITIANIRLASCPNAANTNPFGRPENRAPTCTFVAAAGVTSDTQAAGLSFLEVDTGTQNINTYLMRVAGAAYNTTSTAGYAVAGRFETMVTPIGVCAVDPVNRTSKYTHAPTNQTELVELGFRRGVTYNLFQLNPLASGPSDPYLINPVDAYPNACDPAHSSANFTAPFICTGSSAVLGSGTGKVYTNTGMTASLDSSLNSRFDDYKSPSVCDPSSAPPDTNIKEYHCHPKGVGDPACENSGSLTTPKDWMEPGGNNYPNREFVETTAFNKPNYALPPGKPGDTGITYDRYGPLWSYGPAYEADGSTPPKAGDPILPSEANGTDMYHNATGLNYFDLTNYPSTPGAGFPSNTPAAPYNQTSGPYYQAPSRPGVRNRRVLHIVIVDCTAPPVGPNSCATMDVVGIGKFFMQVPANFAGGPNRYLDAEFAGLIDPVPAADIRLYR